MTTDYKERSGSFHFETDPQADINADAKCWHPAIDEWVDCPGSTGIGVDALWSGDYTAIRRPRSPRCSSAATIFSNVRRRLEFRTYAAVAAQASS